DGPFASGEAASRPATQRADSRPRRQSPLVGFWQLREISGMDPLTATQFRGYLAIGDRHLSLHLLGPQNTQGVPFFQTGFRRYRIDGNILITTVLVGASNKENGDVVIENQPFEEQRAFEFIGPVLRIRKSVHEHMDFVRIE